jgi:hypothetical protein
MKDFGIPNECPVKKGKYTGEYTMQANIPPNFDGKYKIVANVYYLGELRETLITIGEVHHYYVE